MTVEQSAHQLVEKLFRRQSANIVSTLVGVLGPANLQLAEDVTQETLLKALRLWPYRGIPKNPAAWLYTTARNIAIDHLRRDKSFREKSDEIREQLNERLCAPEPSDALLEALSDDTLRMMFICAHPDIPDNAQTALILKTLCGFSVTEIAKAFLTNSDVISQRLSRARKQLRNTNPDFDLTRDQLNERLPAVLGALYLLFSEGYSASGAEHSIRTDLCNEALRLIEALLSNPATATGETAALGALCNLQAARLAARTDESGALVPLEEQDRSKWDSKLQARGFQLLDESMRSDALSVYHLQAGIAANHAGAKSFAETDWNRIVKFYDDLIDLQESPVFQLNRAVAISFVNGLDAALDKLIELAGESEMKSFHLYYATMADLQRRKLDTELARANYEKALTLTKNPAERKFLERRLCEL